MTDASDSLPTPAPSGPTPQEAAASLLASMVDDVKQQLRSAPPNQRASLIAKFMPILSKQIEEKEADDELDQMRAELDALSAEVREALLARPPAPARIPATLPPRDDQ